MTPQEYIIGPTCSQSYARTTQTSPARPWSCECEAGEAPNAAGMPCTVRVVYDATLVPARSQAARLQKRLRGPLLNCEVGMETEITPPEGLRSRSDAAEFDAALPRPGKIEVSAQAIARVAARAAAQCYGVVGIAARRTAVPGVEVLPPARYDRGVDVRFTHDHVALEVSVVLEYGLRISEVARNLIKEVSYAVESALGLHVVEVTVNVQALRVSHRSSGAN